MFTFTTATYTEQEARKADLTGDTFTGVVSARAGATKGNGTVGDFGINVDGVTYNAFDKVQDSASTNRASVIIQRDSTTLPLLIVGALNNSENTAYTAVVAGQTLVGLLGVGTTTSTTYDKFGEVSIVVGTGTVSGTSSPGKFIVKLTPDGSNTPVEVMRIDSDGAVVFAGTVSLGSSTVTTLSVGDGTVAAPSITNTGDTNTGIYFSAADTVDITTAGARAVSVASDQSVTFFGNTYVGLATAAASSVYDLFISTDTAANRGFALQKSVTASNGPNLHLRKSRGTTAAPSVPADGDTLGNLAAQSYAGPGYANAVRLVFESEGTPSATSSPGRFSVYTTPAGSTTAVERWRTNATGATLFATTTDDTVGLLQVNGKVGALSTSATAPAFYALGDTNTGMYFSAADTIDFTSGGTARATIAAAGLTVVAGFGCNTKAPQTAYASGGALAAYGAGANGFDTGANASALHAMVVSLRAALVANGIMS